MKNSYITVTDQFCGAGGSSQGVRNISIKNKGGLEVKLALNHWKLAIETHNTNFPDTIHDCTDISASDPRRYPSTDILITSPECTNHTLAKGVRRSTSQMDMFATGKLDPSAERSHGLIISEAYHSFISYFYGKSQASGLDETFGTVSTRDRFALVNYQEPRIEDCYFRMLKPKEIKLAMAFDQEYVVLGNQKDQVKQLGNAVTPPAMQWLVEKGIESLS